MPFFPEGSDDFTQLASKKIRSNAVNLDAYGTPIEGENLLVTLVLKIVRENNNARLLWEAQGTNNPSFVGIEIQAFGAAAPDIPDDASDSQIRDILIDFIEENYDQEVSNSATLEEVQTLYSELIGSFDPTKVIWSAIVNPADNGKFVTGIKDSYYTYSTSSISGELLHTDLPDSVTIYYRIRAFNDNGSKGEYSNISSVILTNVDLIPENIVNPNPDAPLLECKTANGNNILTWSRQDRLLNYSHCEIQVAEASTGPWYRPDVVGGDTTFRGTTPYTSDLTPIWATSPDFNFIHPAVPAIDLYYRVRIVNEEDTRGPWSNICSINAEIPLAAPVLTAIGSLDNVILKWDNQNLLIFERGVRIQVADSEEGPWYKPVDNITDDDYRGTDVGEYLTISGTEWTHKNIPVVGDITANPSLRTLYYRIRRVDFSNNLSPWSNIASASAGRITLTSLPGVVNVGKIDPDMFDVLGAFSEHALGHWPLDDTVTGMEPNALGELVDITPNRNPLKVTSSSVGQDTGILSKSLTFSGSSGSVARTDTNIGTSGSTWESVSVVFWIKMGTTQRNTALRPWSYYTSNFSMYFHVIPSTNRHELRIRSGSTTYSLAMNQGRNILDNEWHMVFLSYNGSSKEGKIYIDAIEFAKGVLKSGNTNIGLSSVPQGGNTSIGAARVGNRFTNHIAGRIDELRMFSLEPELQHVRYLYFIPQGPLAPIVDPITIPENSIASEMVKLEAILTKHIDDLAVNEDKLADAAVALDKIKDGAVDEDKLADLAVALDKIKDGAVDTDKIKDSAVDTDKLADAAVKVGKVADDAIEASKIKDGAVTAAKILANTITAAQIATGTITATEIASGTITTDEIAANTIKAGDIAANTITASEIAAAAISTSELAADAVTAAKILAGTITSTEIAAAAITATELAADSVIATKIKSGEITSEKIAAAAITSAKIAAGNITATLLAADSVTTAKLAAGAVTANEIASNAITAVKIASDAIEGNKIKAGTIVSNNIGANQIISSLIAASAIKTAQLDAGAVTAEKIAVGTITADRMAAGVIPEDVTVDFSTIPDDTIDSDMIANASIIADKIAANAVVAAKIAANAVVADKIASNAVTADKINANAVTAAKINAGSITAAKMAASSVDLGTATVTGTLKAANIVSDVANIDFLHSGRSDLLTPSGWSASFPSGKLVDHYDAFLIFASGNNAADTWGSAIIPKAGLTDSYRRYGVNIGPETVDCQVRTVPNTDNRIGFRRESSASNVMAIRGIWGLRGLGRSGFSPGAAETAPTDKATLSTTETANRATLKWRVVGNWTSVNFADEYDIEIQLRASSADSWGSVTEKDTTSTSTVIGAALNPSSQYRFRVLAKNSVGDGPWSDWYTGTLGGITPEPLSAPSVLSSSETAGTSTWTIGASWNAISDADRYEVERQSKMPSATSWTSASDIDTTSTSVTLYSALAQNRQYRFRVRALEGANRVSDWSGWSTGSVGSIVAIPSTPGSLSSSETAGTSTWSVLASWGASSGATLYRLQSQDRASGASNWGSRSTFTTTGTSLTIYSSLGQNRQYRFRVRAENTSGNSTYSSWYTDSVGSIAKPLPPALTVTTTVTSSSIRFAWASVSNDDGGYEWRQGSSGAWNGTSRNFYLQTGLSADTSYTFQFRALNADDAAGPITTVTVSTDAAPVEPLPPALTVTTTVTSSSIRFAWASVSNDDGGYEWRQGSSGAWNGTSRNFYLQTGLSADTSYTFQFRALNADDAAGPITTVTVSTAEEELPSLPVPSFTFSRSGNTYTMSSLNIPDEDATWDADVQFRGSTSWASIARRNTATSRSWTTSDTRGLRIRVIFRGSTTIWKRAQSPYTNSSFENP